MGLNNQDLHRTREETGVGMQRMDQNPEMTFRLLAEKEGH